MTPKQTELLLFAAEYAATKHADQKRKYSGAPYVTHCFEVAQIVALHDGTPEQIMAAILHDTVEDTDVSIEDISDYFGKDVADLVGWLTDVSKPEDGNRTERKRIDREHLAQAPAAAQTVKLADLISNTRSIVERDPGFAKVYLREKALLLDVMDKGDWRLRAEALRLLVDGMAKIGGLP